MPPWKKRERACNRYASDGIPIDLECNFGAKCWYIHPNEPDWARLTWKNGRGYLNVGSRSRSRSRERRDVDAMWDRALHLEREKERGRGRGNNLKRERSRDSHDWNRDRDRGPGSPLHRATRPGRLSSPRRHGGYGHVDISSRPSSTSSSRPRRDSIASSAGGDPPPTTASTTTGRPRTPLTGSHTNDSFLLRSPEERKPDLRELERARLQERAKGKGPAPVIDLENTVSGPSAAPASPLPPGLSATSSSFTFPRMSVPPPPPADIPPPTPLMSPAFNVDSSRTQPPPPLPQAPDLDDIIQDEQLLRGVWDTRIHLLTELVEASSSISTLQEDMESIRQLAEASTMLPDGAQERLRERLGQAEAQLHAKQAEYERLRDENASASRIWPVAREQMERDVSLLASYHEMVGYLANLATVTSELQKELAVLGVGKMPDVPVVTEALQGDVEAKMKEEEEKMVPLPPPLPSRKKDEDAMEVDPPPPPLPHRSTTSPSTTAPPPLPHRSPPSERTIAQRDLDEISSRMDGIEKDLAALDDAVWQRENELRDEFTSELEGRAQELYAFVKRGGKRTKGEREGSEEDESGEDDIGHEDDAEIAALQKSLDEMSVQTKDSVKEVDEMTEILENFQTRLELAERQQPEALSEYQAALQRNSDLQTRILALEAADQTSTATVETLQNTLRVHIAAQPPSPPSSPAPRLPSTPLLLHFFREPLKAELRRALVPIIEDVRAGVKKQVEEEVRTVYGVVWDRVESSVRVLGGVERVLAQGGVNVGVNGVNGKEGGAVNGAASH